MLIKNLLHASGPLLNLRSYKTLTFILSIIYAVFINGRMLSCSLAIYLIHKTTMVPTEQRSESMDGKWTPLLNRATDALSACTLSKPANWDTALVFTCLVPSCSWRWHPRNTVPAGSSFLQSPAEAEDSVANKASWLREFRESLLSLHNAFTLCASMVKSPLCLEWFYLKDPFNLDSFSSTHLWTYIGFTGQVLPFWRTLSLGQLIQHSIYPQCLGVPISILQCKEGKCRPCQNCSKLLQQKFVKL